MGSEEVLDLTKSPIEFLKLLYPTGIVTKQGEQKMEDKDWRSKLGSFGITGELVLVSHDFRLIGQVAKEIWVCDKKTITPWAGDIQSYKKCLKKDVMKKFKA